MMRLGARAHPRERRPLAKLSQGHVTNPPNPAAAAQQRHLADSLHSKYARMCTVFKLSQFAAVDVCVYVCV